jgi:hypothetical protein
MDRQGQTRGQTQRPTQGPQGWRRKWQPLLFAFAILLHLVVGGAVEGALAAESGRSSFIICSIEAGGDHHSGPVEPASHRHMPDCCIAGCPMLAGAATTVISAVDFGDHVRSLGRIFPPDTLAALPPERQPFAPRAPPMMA